MYLRLIIIILSFVFIFNFTIHANEPKLYVPNIIEINEVDLDIVRSLNKKAKYIYSIEDNMRGVGANIYQTMAPITVYIQTDDMVGSGFLVDDIGHIITNYHVVQKDLKNPNQFHNSVYLKFCLASGQDIKYQTVYQADVVKIDPTRDLALLKLNSLEPVKNIMPANLDYGENVLIGMDVHAIGHPEGNPCTYTKGVVSSIRKNYDWYYDEFNSFRATVIQTQTPINPGNSGGPLINDDGLVVGINTFVQSEAIGINFAVSSIEIDDFLNDSQNENESSWITKSESSWITKKQNDELKNCGYEIPIREEDTDNNGFNDVFYFDTDCNSLTDLFGYDEDEDGEIDVYYLDNNESGTHNVRIDSDTTDEGDLFVRYYYDDDEDGKYEEVCFDIDLDEEIDQCREVS